MTINTTTIAERSRQQQDMTILIGKLKLHQQHAEDITALGCTTEKEAKDRASQYLTKASPADIIAAMREIEQIKAKRYDAVKVSGIDAPPYAGIPDSLTGISKAELRAFIDASKRTTFASGNKYQPLPTHDEAWQLYTAIFQDSHVLKQRSRALRSRCLPVVTDAEIKNAATWGFWREMTIDLRRRAFLLLPYDIRTAISRDHKNDPDAAMDATRDWYDELRQ